jgi:hypothetical protein
VIGLLQAAKERNPRGQSAGVPNRRQPKPQPVIEEPEYENNRYDSRDEAKESWFVRMKDWINKTL